jgi:hypothetical protein
MVRCFYIVLLLSFFSKNLFSQKLNRLNKKGERTGRWIVYLDSAKTKKSTEGRYKNGNAKGRFYYYTMDGVLERRETNCFKRLKTVMYYPDGTVRFRGKARIENLPTKIHYYFYGKWKYYDQKGKLLKYCFYEKGVLMKTVYADKNNKTNDSLISALNEMDKRFQEFNKDLLDSITRSGFNVQKRERLQTELFMTDTLTYHNLDVIFLRYTYPSKERALDAVIIPFYILSYAPVGIREKYLPLLKTAANKGDLEWKTLAFFIDKLKVAKNEKQIYGTQSYYSQKKWIKYPVEDSENLEARRKKVGL